jgi:hypothetical protein
VTIYAVASPVPLWLDLDGSPLDNGELFLGVAGQNPVTTPVAVYWDSSGTQPASLPLKTMNGMAVRNGAPSIFYVDGDYSVMAFNKRGSIAISAASSLLVNPVAALELALAASDGSNGIGWLQAGAGAVARTLQDKNRDIVDARDFGIRASNTAAANSAGMAYLLTKCNTNSPNAPMVTFPEGTITFDTPLAPAAMFLKMRGQGQNQTVLAYTGASGSAIAPAAQTYFRPSISDMTITASASTGHAIDTTNIASQVYDGSFDRLTLSSGGNALHMPSVFSFAFNNIRASSSSGHAFLAKLGPGVKWDTCYAVSAGTGKCGYRFAGNIYMLACNGVDNAERWGVFGQDPTATDGFQADFAGGFVDYVIAHLESCNVEAFAINGITLHNSHRKFKFESGKLDRGSLSTNYESVVTIKKQGIDINTPVTLAPGFWNPGPGIAKGTDGSGNLGTATGAVVFVASGSVCVQDETGGLIPRVFDATVGTAPGTLVPTVRMGVAQDVFGGRALDVNAMQAQRLSVGMNHFIVGTPTVASNAIDVTGFAKVKVTPGAAVNVDHANFDTTVGADNDASRNGDLYIEAGNTNLSLVHSASGANTFRLKGAPGSPVNLAAGEIRHFSWSGTSSQWIEV